MRKFLVKALISIIPLLIYVVNFETFATFGARGFWHMAAVVAYIVGAVALTMWGAELLPGGLDEN